MKTVSYYNPTNQIQHKGGVSIPPHDCRDIPAQFAPAVVAMAAAVVISLSAAVMAAIEAGGKQLNEAIDAASLVLLVQIRLATEAAAANGAQRKTALARIGEQIETLEQLQAAIALASEADNPIDALSELNKAAKTPAEKELIDTAIAAVMELSDAPPTLEQQRAELLQAISDGEEVIAEQAKAGEDTELLQSSLDELTEQVAEINEKIAARNK